MGELGEVLQQLGFRAACGQTAQHLAHRQTRTSHARLAESQSRVALRASEEDRELLDRAATTLDTDRSAFLLAQGRLAAQRVLADRQRMTTWGRWAMRPSRPGWTKRRR